MFFNLASCPSGWSELTSARGRYLVGLNSGGSLAATQGTALTDQEDRSGTKGLSNPEEVHGATGAPVYTMMRKTVAGTNAPYMQLLVCQKD
ncbi:hypothetical protein BMS3Abin17_00298 [archaeon BMS3Abin17]|nr:hypothetical protein BMS3Abin17_00298 [archaeon BMS3Abin17]HDZ60377.1 hypothetical protein [Candidatus Pacearchaeota archaeon]